MLVFIGASRSTVPFIQAAKNMGLKTIAFDRDMSAPGAELVDEFHNISVVDYDKIWKVLQLRHLTGCFTYSSMNGALETWVGINCQFVLHTKIDIPWNQTSNKRLMKHVLINHGIATPELADSGTVVIKPEDGTGGEGVRYIENFTGPAAGLVEEYIEGEVYSVDGFVNNGKAYILSVCHKKVVRSKDRFIVQGFETLGFQESFLKSGLALKVVGAFEVDNSFYSIDMIAGSDGLQAIDVGLLIDCRMDRLYWHVGIDIYKIGIQLALGEDIEMVADYIFLPGYSMRFFYPTNQIKLSQMSRLEIRDPDSEMIAREI